VPVVAATVVDMSNQTTTLPAHRSDDPAFEPAATPTVPAASPGHPAASMTSRSRGPRRAWRGREDDPAWVRPALLGLLGTTALLYLWGLGASGWANSFYSAAVQAGSESWKAFFFGSSDAASSITVDKPPLSLWTMAVSVRLFGLSSWSILVPQALMGVASVGLLHATVRRTTGSAAAGLLAGAVLALTPVAVLMFRFNNPDALLTLLVIGSVACTVRALESGRLRALEQRAHPVRWLALGGALVGLAFLTKMLQAFLVLPALALVYLLAAHTPIGRRIAHLLVALASMIAAAGWWIATVELWPASSRPYIGGSQGNSILELTLGYNGFGRITGNEVGSVGGGAGGGGAGMPGGIGQWGETGILRMFGSEVGGQIAWLLPAALVLLVAGLWFTRRHPRTDLQRAGLVVWGVLLLVTTVTFSFMAGIFHAYYTVALAPPIAALVGTGAVLLWQRRDSYAAALVLAATTALTTALAFLLLDRSPDHLPWLKWMVAVLGLVAAVLLAGVRHLPKVFALGVASTALVAGLAGPATYAVSTMSTAHTGSLPTAGPTTGAGPGGGFRGGPGGGFGGAPGGARMGTPPGAPGQAPGGRAPAGPAPGGQAPAGTGTAGATVGGLLEGSRSSAAMTSLLQEDADSYTWAAAAVGSNTAAGYQLASEEPVMAIGGFNGSDPSPTLARFQQYVADGEIHYFIAGGGGIGGRGGSESGTGSSISAWVEDSFTATTVDGVTVYDLSGGVS
jgi:4-amino-4-deoxy-L-arabinose transferase-like glycosyltransferase